MMFFRRFVLFLVFACAAAGAWAQPVGHLGVPGAQMVRSDFATVAGLPATNHYLLNVVHPDGTVDTMSSAYLLRQTLVYVDLVLIIFRNSASVPGSAESGEIYLGDYDSSLKARPVQTRWHCCASRSPPTRRGWSCACRCRPGVPTAATGSRCSSTTGRAA